MILVITNKNDNLKFSLIGFGDKTEMIFQNEYEPGQLKGINVDVSSSKV